MTATNSHCISPQQAHEWLSSGEAILIDVREPDEYRNEHIAYAVSMPLSGVCDAFAQLRLPPSRKVIFQCLRGGRGEQACAIIDRERAGCAVYNITGGIQAWKETGLPVIRGGGVVRGVSLFRQVQMIVGALVLVLSLLGLAGHEWGVVFAAALGLALAFAGVTGWCGLALILARAPWNRPS